MAKDRQSRKGDRVTWGLARGEGAGLYLAAVGPPSVLIVKQRGHTTSSGNFTLRVRVGSRLKERRNDQGAASGRSFWSSTRQMVRCWAEIAEPWRD